MNKLLFTRLRGKNAAVLVSEKRAVQMDFEPETAKDQTGSIYIGKVRNIVKNLNAAFVEYKPGVNGYYSLSDNRTHLFADGRPRDTLKSGDEILVQVARAAVKTKDAVLSSELALTGQYVVVSSRAGSFGISAKIHDRQWKEEMKRQWEEQADRSVGLVVRTNAYSAGPEAVWAEAGQLSEKLNALIAAAPSRVCYSVLGQADGFTAQMAKNARVADTEEIVTDEKDIYEELQALSRQGFPIPIRFYSDDSFPLAALYHLNTELDRALSKTVWLDSGGYLVIEPTEAMTVIDVNTGKNTEKKSFREIYRLTNLQAAKEIAWQLRLRNLSGIILVDFIDLDTDADKQELLKTFRKYLAADPVKTVLVDMTALGLVEVTRKKIRRPLHEQVNRLV